MGAKCRKEYIAKSVAALARARGISRSTYYRRAKAENITSEVPCDRMPVQRKKIGNLMLTRQPVSSKQGTASD